MKNLTGKKFVERTIERLPRPCNRCDRKFVPSSKGSKICDICFKKALDRRKKGGKYVKEILSSKRWEEIIKDD